jgi:acetyl-CoA synthetase
MVAMSISESKILWNPSEEIIQQAHLANFMRQHDIQSLEQFLHQASKDIAWFTEAVLDYLEIHFRKPYTKIVDLQQGNAWPQWCVDGRLNIVDSCLDQNLSRGASSNLALLWEGEEGKSETLTFLELTSEVSRVASGLRLLGLKKGDAVGLFMPMIPEVVIALLAIAKIGAVILPLFSGYGAGAVSQRLQDAGARALFTADGFLRRGNTILMKQVADEAIARVPTIDHVIVTNRIDLDVPMQDGRDHWWDEIMLDQPDSAPTEDTEAEDLLMILYTSGTSGRPKGAVHTHCGFPIKSAQDMAFGMDIHSGDRIYWMTDMGWMMGPWLVFGSLILGASMFIYDGAPDFPGPDRVWSLVDRHKITALGLSPTFVRAIMAYGEEPLQSHNLSSLKLFGSTGEPWNPDPWMWLFETVGKKKLPIINYSGGTEISGGILMGNPISPLKPTAFSGPCPGIAADILDEEGRSVRNEVGELVIRAPWIGMTRGFWKDPQRYEETYWSRFPDIWVHGDWAYVDDDNMWYILGRSDDTIKVAGKRMGPAEVESVLVSHPSVVEAAAIGIPDPIKGNAIVCFCVLKDCQEEEKSLQEELHQRLVQELGKPMAPKLIRFVSDIPKTRNAKVMRRVLKATYMGEDPGDISSLVNPESLDAIGSLRQ